MTQVLKRCTPSCEIHCTKILKNRTTILSSHWFYVVNGKKINQSILIRLGCSDIVHNKTK
jgi:hypothetical protein